MAFDFDAFNTVNGRLGVQLFSLLPTLSAANGLKTAAAANAAAQREIQNRKIDTSGIEVEARLADRRADNFQRLQPKLDSTVKAVTRARDTLLELKTFLSEMRRLVVLAQGDTIDDDERRQHADTFNQLLGKLNIKVRASGGTSGNLIGNSIRDIFDAQEITYKTKPDSATSRTISGVYSASDYTITDNDGNLFFVDDYGSVLLGFPLSNDDDGETIGDADTVSYDSGTGAISITHDGDTDPFIEGTLERKGLGVLHSFLYGNFTDPDLLDAALDDIDAASATLRFNITLIEGQLTKVTAHRDFNAKLVEENRSLASKIDTQKTVEIQKQALEKQRQQLLFVSAFQNTVSFDASGTLLSLGINNLYDIEV